MNSYRKYKIMGENILHSTVVNVLAAEIRQLQIEQIQLVEENTKLSNEINSLNKMIKKLKEHKPEVQNQDNETPKLDIDFTGIKVSFMQSNNEERPDNNCVVMTIDGIKNKETSDVIISHLYGTNINEELTKMFDGIAATTGYQVPLKCFKKREYNGVISNGCVVRHHKDDVIKVYQANLSPLLMKTFRNHDTILKDIF